MCRMKKTHKINSVTTTETHRQSSDNEDDYVFTVIDRVEDGTLTVLVNEQPVEMLIDSGATCNIVTETKFAQLSKSDITLQCPEKLVYPFASTTPLHVKGIFVAGHCKNPSK